MLLVVILVFAGCVSSDPAIAPPSLVVKPTPTVSLEAQTVTFCDLVANPELYNGKIIRTQATAVTTFEVAFLYDLPCNREGAWTYFEATNDESSKAIEVLLGEFVRGKARRAKMTISGRFDGPSKEGYGHLNSFRFRFLIMNVEKGEPVPPDAPWPWESKK